MNGGPVFLAIQVDYYAKMWVNGDLVADIDGGHGSPKGYIYVPVTLEPGENQVFVKVAAGSKGHKFALAVSEVDSSVGTSGFMSDLNEGK
ncbi:hypothetical protein [Puniceicoccus vermicola]|uniref:Uncharacterized protein n=1 Tax=Puniceicoccus vermicola TaxID=388746 RepID=A0A7X1AZ51_9BACT|nr:hypothetical protein [Puniceicoccus vermicola]MBC2602650.1 hypothetical protein [Puniceicoccus vermicola]